jgi:hypothetical protein
MLKRGEQRKLNETDYGYTNKKVICYRIPSPKNSAQGLPQGSSQGSPQGLPKGPISISLDEIDQMTNTYLLKKLETEYDDYLDKYQHLLLLHDLIDDYLDIRDALTIRLSRIERMERLKWYQEKYNSHYSIREEVMIGEYDHSLQNILPDDLKLTETQIQQGYTPYPNEPREFKCGCLTMKYYCQCDCKRVSAICKNPNCKEKMMPIVKLQYHCLNHCQLKRKEEYLEQELTKVKKELSDIKRQSNSLDFEDYKNSISNNPKRRRVSRFPWKNI